MRRECTVCRQAFLHRSVQKFHTNLNVCMQCQEAIVKIVAIA